MRKTLAILFLVLALAGLGFGVLDLSPKPALAQGAVDNWTTPKNGYVVVTGAVTQTGGSAIVVSAVTGTALSIQAIDFASTGAGVWNFYDSTGTTTCIGTFYLAANTPRTITLHSFGATGMSAASGNAIYAQGPAAGVLTYTFLVQKK